mmetsp:Transcript_34622/g.87604  ORF Transcript_34622/g.87604 Transcript_34622/m.87604 type:complete len:342 (+) Transcript_34622:1301-2326(+)
MPRGSPLATPGTPCSAGFSVRRGAVTPPAVPLLPPRAWCDAAAAVASPAAGSSPGPLAITLLASGMCQGCGWRISGTEEQRDMRLGHCGCCPCCPCGDCTTLPAAAAAALAASRAVGEEGGEIEVGEQSVERVREEADAEGVRVSRLLADAAPAFRSPLSAMPAAKPTAAEAATAASDRGCHTLAGSSSCSMASSCCWPTAGLWVCPCASACCSSSCLCRLECATARTGGATDAARDLMVARAAGPLRVAAATMLRMRIPMLAPMGAASLGTSKPLSAPPPALAAAATALPLPRWVAKAAGSLTCSCADLAAAQPLAAVMREVAARPSLCTAGQLLKSVIH